KFHPIFGPDLKVGFETTFPKGAEPKDLDPLYGRNGLIHDPPSETVVRIYEPARVTGSCLDGEMAQILFVPVSQKGSVFRRLVFARKIGDDGHPRRWMIVARHGEIATFGFDSWNSKNQRYLALAYPGEGSEFVPTYIKIQDVNGGFVYLELGAYDDEVQVLFTARRVNENAVPKLLKNLEVWNEEGKEE
ncbi:MAG: hypothetical protein AAB655_01665, partial [Patescibacteria group bacterium]